MTIKTLLQAGHSNRAFLPAEPDYHYYPTQWQTPYTERRRACGLQLYQSLQIARGDKAAHQAQWAANYRAFDAPVMYCFFWTTPCKPVLI